MAAEELRETALKAMEADGDITLNLDGVDHLDASSLQILLALGKEQKKRGRHLDMVNASSHLRRWFEYSGAADDFFRDGAEAR
jgi:anti-anti-sigma factor